MWYLPRDIQHTSSTAAVLRAKCGSHTSANLQKKAADMSPPHQPPLVPTAQLSLRLLTSPPAQRLRSRASAWIPRTSCACFAPPCAGSDRDPDGAISDGR